MRTEAKIREKLAHTTDIFMIAVKSHDDHISALWAQYKNALEWVLNDEKRDETK